MIDRAVIEVYAMLRAGELDMIYARQDEKTGLVYCTLKPREPVLPEITDRLSQWPFDAAALPQDQRHD